MQIASVGIDLGKGTFHLVALDDNGRKKFSRKQLLAYTASQPSLQFHVLVVANRRIRAPSFQQLFRHIVRPHVA